jgi:hypothetical protein
MSETPNMIYDPAPEGKAESDLLNIANLWAFLQDERLTAEFLDKFNTVLKQEGIKKAASLLKDKLGFSGRRPNQAPQSI